MNKFATIVPAIRFRKVTYYSVQFEEEGESLFLQFVNKHAAGDEYFEDLSLIRSWLRKIGEQIGAQDKYFRFEGARKGDARALPPPAKFIRVDCSLRLYCMRINDRIVILFGGAKKTAEKAQDCDQVRPHLFLANKLTQAIDQAIKDKGIVIDDKHGKLIFDAELTLEI